MAFYKLFKIIHRRTDWYKLWRLEREFMMPEWYEERRKQGQIALNKLAMANALVCSLNDSYKMKF